MVGGYDKIWKKEGWKEDGKEQEGGEKDRGRSRKSEVKRTGQKGERNQKIWGKEARVERKDEHRRGKGQCMGKRKERKEDRGKRGGEETRQRRNSCCYLSADDLKWGQATDTAAVLAALAPRS